jgi:exopolysaccharide biosynthesis polyprenyl glycosylphosphotransferase
MVFSGKKESSLLFLGDLLCFFASLWLMLLVRYQKLPDQEVFLSHLQPFSILFLIWILVFFIAGLYEKHTLLFQSKLPSTIFHAQIANIFLAVMFFYLIPYFGITPKTNLFIYLLISSTLILLWRIWGQKVLGLKLRQNAILIGSGAEIKEIIQEVNNNPRYGLYFISSIDLDEVESLDFRDEVLKTVYGEGVNIIATDLKNEKIEPILPNLYNLIFSKVRFVDMYKVYEDIFDRVPLSLVKYNWFLENISSVHNAAFDLAKRLMDILASLIVGAVSLILYPLIFVMIKLEDGGPIFFVQERVGENNRLIKIFKFRSMREEGERRQVTKIGSWLRKLRLDELPQLWNVLLGDLSLIGPRPEIPEIAKVYENQIPYYNVRHLIKPGLSGWAQIYHQTPPKFDLDHNETAVKLSYDLYYLKNRSFMLDVKIALKTLKTLLSTKGI